MLWVCHLFQGTTVVTKSAEVNFWLQNRISCFPSEQVVSTSEPPQVCQRFCLLAERLFCFSAAPVGPLSFNPVLGFSILMLTSCWLTVSIVSSWCPNVLLRLSGAALQHSGGPDRVVSEVLAAAADNMATTGLEKLRVETGSKLGRVGLVGVNLQPLNLADIHRGQL